MTALGTDIAHAAGLLRRGDLVAIPTETVYGLAGNATDADALRKIFKAKGRPLHNPLILHIKGIEALDRYAVDVPAAAYALAEHFWPGPLTLLLQKRPDTLPDILNNALPEVAIRVPRHPMTLALLKELDFPLAAPSANPFGYISPTTAEHVLQQLGGRIPYILDGGPCPSGIESTIVRFEDGRPVVLRAGAIPVDALAEIVGNVTVQTHQTKEVVAPGMLASHYSPRTPLVLVDDAGAYLQGLRAGKYGAILFKEGLPGMSMQYQAILSPGGLLVEAARNLYSAMHRLDALGLDLIIAERMPHQGIGEAINDRLSRASTEKKD